MNNKYQDVRVIPWVNTDSFKEFFGIKVKVGGQWFFYAENGEPVFGSFSDMHNKREDLITEKGLK